MRGLVYAMAAVVVSMFITVAWDSSVYIDAWPRQPVQYQEVHRNGYTRQDVEFPCHDQTCHAWLYSPTASTPSSPIIILAHGIGSQKDFGLERYSAAFAEAGLASLAIDYRGFGGSTGLPRHLIDPEHHTQDIVSAVQHLQALGYTDVGLWGTSFGGGHVLQAALELGPHTLRGVVAQVPHLDGQQASIRGIRTRGLLGSLRLGLAALSDLVLSSYLGVLDPVHVKIAGPVADLAVMPLAEADLYAYRSKIPVSPLGGWRNIAPARFLFKVRSYSPLDALRAQNLTVPALLIGAQHDSLCPAALVQEAGAFLTHPLSQTLVVEQCSHFDIYTRQDVIDSTRDFFLQVFQ